MPKVPEDIQLFDEVARVLRETGGSYAVAARALRVERPMLWRFMQSKRAIPRTRARLSQALVEYKNATKEPVAPQSETIPDPAPAFVDELTKVRAMCQSVVTLIDLFMLSSAVKRSVTASPDEPKPRHS
jgi:hypothetical protein